MPEVKAARGQAGFEVDPEEQDHDRDDDADRPSIGRGANPPSAFVTALDGDGDGDAVWSSEPWRVLGIGGEWETGAPAFQWELPALHISPNTAGAADPADALDRPTLGVDPPSAAFITSWSGEEPAPTKVKVAWRDFRYVPKVRPCESRHRRAPRARPIRRRGSRRTSAPARDGPGGDSDGGLDGEPPGERRLLVGGRR